MKVSSPGFLRVPFPSLRTSIRLRAYTPRCSLSSVTSISRSVREGTSKAEDHVTAALDRISLLDDRVGAFLSVNADRALTQAQSCDKDRANGKSLGPLAGVPIAVKDNLCVVGGPTTAGSRILDSFYPAYTASAVKRLEDAGAIIIGKTNLDEFGMGSSTETSAYQTTANPWDIERVPGGSSGGSASALAAGMCAAAIGSDTGGSIRQPASFCSITGLKPSYGRVSRYGLLAYASSLDTVGPLCNSVEDTALLLGIMAGADEKDGTTSKTDVPKYLNGLNNAKTPNLKGVTIGVVAEAHEAGVDAEVLSCITAAVETLRGLGATVRKVSLPRLSASTAAYYILALSEASANLARYDGVRYGVRDKKAENALDLYMRSRAQGLGDEVKRRIMVGTFALSSGYYDDYYLRAQRVRTLVTNDLKDVFDSGVDVLVSPVSPTPAFRLGEKITNPVSMYLDDLMTIPASLAGLPALSVPCGFTSDNLPIGLQIIGPFLEESRILTVGHAFQRVSSHHLQRAPMKEDLAIAV